MDFLCCCGGVSSRVVNVLGRKNENDTPKKNNVHVAAVDNKLVTTPRKMSCTSVSKSRTKVHLKRDLTVLVVDDSTTIAKLTKMALMKMGHVVEIANNGLAGKDKMEAKEYDIVLMDIQMPIMGGMEAVRLFRDFEQSAMDSGSRSKKQLVIGMSAMDDDEVWDKALLAGMDDFLQKPFDLGALTAVIGTRRPDLVSRLPAAKDKMKKNSDMTDDINDSLHGTVVLGDSENGRRAASTAFPPGPKERRHFTVESLRQRESAKNDPANSLIPQLQPAPVVSQGTPSLDKLLNEKVFTVKPDPVLGMTLHTAAPTISTLLPATGALVSALPLMQTKKLWDEFSSCVGPAGTPGQATTTGTCHPSPSLTTSRSPRSPRCQAVTSLSHHCLSAQSPFLDGGLWDEEKEKGKQEDDSRLAEPVAHMSKK